MKLINDLWILTEEGIAIFSRVLNSKIQDQLFGALLSSLNIFSQRLADGGLKQFKLNKVQFVLLKSNNFLFVASTSSKEKIRKVNQELSNIANLFFKKFSSILDKWDGDISIFSDFIKEIDANIS